MSVHFTTTSLVNSVKRRMSVPLSQSTFTEQDIVDYLNDEMISVVVPMMMNVREDYFISSTDFTITDTTTEFEIPADAIGMRLRDLVLVENVGGDETLSNIPRLTLEQISSGNTINGSQSSASNYDYSGFHLIGNKVKLYPSTGWVVNQTLRMYYFQRPSQLVKVSSAGKILSIDTGTKTLTLDALPATWTTADSVDGINATQPFANPVKGLTISNIAGFDLTVSSVTDLIVGDYISLNGTSPIPQIPEEAQQLLLQGVKIQMLDSQADEKMWQMAQKKYTQMQEQFINSITPRVDGQAKKIVSRNGVFNFNRNRSFW